MQIGGVPTRLPLCLRLHFGPVACNALRTCSSLVVGHQAHCAPPCMQVITLGKTRPATTRMMHAQMEDIFPGMAYLPCTLNNLVRGAA